MASSTEKEAEWAVSCKIYSQSVLKPALIFPESTSDLDDGMHVAAVVGGKVHALGPAKESCGIDAGVADGGRVNDGRHFFNVLGQ